MAAIVSEETIQQASASLSRCLENPGFLERFYELFMASSEEVREKFRDTDFSRQRAVLRDSLYAMMTAAGTASGPAHLALEDLARRHSRAELDVRPELYTLWLDTLIQAVKECDASFSEELEEAWRGSLSAGIELMKAAYVGSGS
jgi:hemoglobin-like flavoprotein